MAWKRNKKRKNVWYKELRKGFGATKVLTIFQTAGMVIKGKQLSGWIVDIETIKGNLITKQFKTKAKALAFARNYMKKN